MAVLSKPMAVLSSFINNGRFIKVEDQVNGRNGRFINQKRPNGQIGLRMADFILPRIRSLSAGAGPTGFPKQVSERRKTGGSWRPPRHTRPKAYVAIRAAQIIKGEVAAMAVLSTRSGWPDL